MINGKTRLLRCGTFAALMAMLAAGLVAPGAAVAQVPQSNAAGVVSTVTRPKVERDRAGSFLEPMNSSERQAYACLLGGGASMLAAQLAGANEAVLIIAGGSLIPTNPVLLWSALTGTLFASVCAASAVAVPAVIRMWDYYVEGLRPLPDAAYVPEGE